MIFWALSSVIYFSFSCEHFLFLKLNFFKFLELLLSFLWPLRVAVVWYLDGFRLVEIVFYERLYFTFLRFESLRFLDVWVDDFFLFLFYYVLQSDDSLVALGFIDCFIKAFDNCWLFMEKQIGLGGNFTYRWSSHRAHWRINDHGIPLKIFDRWWSTLKNS